MEAKSIEKRGKSVDEAIKAALEELGCDIDDAIIEVIEEPARGLLGLVKKPAVVRVTRRDKPEEEVRKVLEDLLKKMKIDYEIRKVESEEGRVRINISGKDMGLLIGRKGETLNSLQFMVGLIVNRRRQERIRVILDVEDYRKKKEQSLEALALRLSERVKKTKRNVVMRPMNSQERRIVHTALQGDPQVTTYSMGDEPNRKVVISLKK
ncbi:MAG: RNA-binding cell elongation regulator Jag/EloR [Syntrophomonadaceae bacterium]|nr:RNA-binding cell elongation regulator Jag/EloR [Bacillota bacterium]NLM88166.1 protein jag [Syntrophomonadaceae bacterium]HAA08309.1 protein jag [Syntrophomonas sp.]HQA50324.1 RNA-binding cell elongation regulator Jag/EloR [Syntrophomonadaceae bacterium]HQD89543.1 RNA-binding cell elongation regulator Jag/EloR [Syntrophomonadaceae bacterium]